MAKSKSFFGLRTGSTKTLTFQVLNGQQITKDRVSNVKNPRTEAQMKQRMCMATASAAYAAMKEIVDHSFEGVTYGQMSMSEFIKLNTKKLAANIDASPEKFGYVYYQDREFQPGEYVIATGSLAPAKDTGVYQSVTSAGKVKIGVNLSDHEGLTADWLIADLGLQIGDMVTYIIQYPTPVSADEPWDFTFCRLKVLKGGTTALTTENFNEYFAVESPIAWTLSIADGMVELETTNAIAYPSYGCFISHVHSRQSANGWLRSNAVLSVPLQADMISSEAAFASYPVGNSYVLNGGEIE